MTMDNRKRFLRAERTGIIAAVVATAVAIAAVALCSRQGETITEAPAADTLQVLPAVKEPLSSQPADASTGEHKTSRHKGKAAKKVPAKPAGAKEKPFSRDYTIPVPTEK